jgi:hypothetical protein
MNAKEGMRRLGIFLGVCGGILGGFLGYSNAKATWDSHIAVRKFESLMATPTMRKVAKAARDYQHDNPQGKTNGDRGDWFERNKPDALDEKHGESGEVRADPWEEAAKEYERDLRGIVVAVNLAGIKQVTVNKTGLISSIELPTGAVIQRVDPPALRAYLIPLLYPVLGFLLPWGGIRVITWVGSGFFQPPR